MPSTPLDANTRSAMIHLLLPDIREALRRDPQEAREVFEELHGADAADLLTRLEEDEVRTLLHLLPAEEAARILEYVDSSTAARYLEEVHPGQIADIAEEMDPDERADLLAHLPEEDQEVVLAQMEPAEREDAEELLRHADETAGRLMTPHFVTVDSDDRAAAALEAAREAARRGWSVTSVWAIDGDGTLRGKLPLVKILAAAPEAPVREIMEEGPLAVTVSTDQEQVAKVLSKYDLLTVPVIDADRKLVGIVTVDDVVDILIEEGTEDAHRLGAVTPLENPYFETGFWSMARKRALWLSLLFGAELLTGSTLHHFSGLLEATVALMFFVPLITSSGGNSGSQSATLITRALAVGEVHLRDFLRVLRRELGMGVTLGAFLGLMGLARALIWKTSIEVAVVVALTLTGVVVIGSMVGALLPLVFKRVGLDPAITSSPFVASVVDVAGILLYLSIAAMILGH